MKGDGIEFADIRPFAPATAPRINWRASARRSELYVNERHPERNSDVVALPRQLRRGARAGEATLDQAVRAAASLADAYLERRDRVGLVRLRRHPPLAGPAMGRQHYRIVDALIDTESCFSYALKDVDVLPPDAAAAGARRRAHPVARRAPVAALARPARARLRPRRRRRLAAPFVDPPGRASRRARSSGSGRCGARPCALATSGSASPWPVGTKPLAAHRGGDRIPSLRAFRASA